MKEELKESLEDFEILDETMDNRDNHIWWEEEVWSKLVYTYEDDGIDMRAVMYVSARDYEVYAKVYTAPEDAFYKDFAEANDILEGSYFDNTQLEADMAEAKRKLVGEWDCGDQGYLVFREDDTVSFYQDDSKDEDFVIKDGERICQMVIAQHAQVEWQEVDVVEETERGAGGFGHTGK